MAHFNRAPLALSLIMVLSRSNVLASWVIRIMRKDHCVRYDANESYIVDTIATQVSSELNQHPQHMLLSPQKADHSFAHPLNSEFTLGSEAKMLMKCTLSQALLLVCSVSGPSRWGSASETDEKSSRFCQRALMSSPQNHRF